MSPSIHTTLMASNRSWIRLFLFYSRDALLILYFRKGILINIACPRQMLKPPSYTAFIYIIMLWNHWIILRLWQLTLNMHEVFNVRIIFTNLSESSDIILSPLNTSLKCFATNKCLNILSYVGLESAFTYSKLLATRSTKYWWEIFGYIPFNLFL